MKLTRRDWIHLLMLWLGGIDLRMTLLAIPPVLPLIHHQLNLNEKAVGALVALPVLLLAIAAVPGSLLIAKLGIRRALMVGLGLVAVFGAVRGFGPSTPTIFSATFLMGVGVAVSQPAFPALVREWFPRRIAIATAVYSNGILIGETLPTAFTTPIGVLTAAHGDWRYAIASWSVIVVVTGLLIVIAAPRVIHSSAPSRWWPSWREGQAVRVGLVMGMASAVYFASNAYIPDFLDQTGRHALIAPTLAVLNGSQLLTAPAVTLWDRLATGHLGFIGSSVLMGLAQLGLVLSPGAFVIPCAFVLGFACALSFIVALTMPARVAAAGDVHRMSAAIFTVQYGTGFVLPLIAGALWDASGVAILAFVPGLCAAGAMSWLALPLRIPAAQKPAT
ncbi:MAG TPA: MFS transporter [Patescibacteria group bacterium]|nr:MFS transporter [Patescibacteria group bacterium]